MLAIYDENETLAGTQDDVGEISATESLPGERLAHWLSDGVPGYVSSIVDDVAFDQQTIIHPDSWKFNFALASYCQSIGWVIREGPLTNAEPKVDWDAINAEHDARIDAIVAGKIQPGELLTNTAWQFHTSSEQIQAFKIWLDQQVKKDVLGKGEDAIWQKYAMEGYKKGVGRAFDDIKKPYAKGYAAAGQSTADFYAGSRYQFLQSAFAHPIAIDKIKLLAGRTYSDLEGVTDAMSAQMTRTLTDGLVQGKSPNIIAKDLADDVDDIGIRRGTMIARTEIIRAHAEGQLDAMQQMGVEEVGVAVEFTVTPDEKVCPLCQALEGVILKIDEARGVIPQHPDCRCCFSPANVGEDDAGQKDTKKEIVQAFEEAGEPDKDISKERPESILNSNPDFDEHLFKLYDGIPVLDGGAVVPTVHFGKIVPNTFCPTGPGGGVDPTCSPHGAGELAEVTPAPEPAPVLLTPDYSPPDHSHLPEPNSVDQFANTKTAQENVDVQHEMYDLAKAGKLDLLKDHPGTPSNLVKSYKEKLIQAMETASGVATPSAFVAPSPTPVAPVSKAGKAANPLHNGEGLSSYISSHMKLTPLRLQKIEAFNPQGLKSGTVYIPGGMLDNKANVAKLQAILPPGTQIKAKSVSAAQLVTTIAGFGKFTSTAAAPGSVSVDTPAFAKSYLPPIIDGAVSLKTGAMSDYKGLNPKTQSWKKDLTTDEHDAIGTWKGTAKYIRQSISSGKPSDTAKAFVSAITKAPQHQGVVYRGVHGDYAKKLFNDIKATGINGEWSDDAPHCMSPNHEKAYGFSLSSGLMFRIVTKTGRDISSVQGYNHSSISENEVTGTANTKYSIKGVHKNVSMKGLGKVAYFVDLQEV
jgi:SPP1 gp7 family putative phage head morphogenesis protein